MALTLDVLPGWQGQVRSVWQSFPGIVPVVKGNGYGFGRARLAAIAEDLAVNSGQPDGELAVGTIYETADLSGGLTPLLLTPLTPGDAGYLNHAVSADGKRTPIFTVGSHDDVATLARLLKGAGPRSVPQSVVLKVASSMRRYGVMPDRVTDLADTAGRAGFVIHGYGVHLPLDQTDEASLAEATELLTVVPDGTAFYVSHLSAQANQTLAALRPGVRIRSRVGTALWLGDKQHLRLIADVSDVRPVRSGELAGYRQVPVPGDGHLVMVTAGTAHGVQPLPDGRSPFHFARTRLALLEPPHMHTSMCFVPMGDPLPTKQDQVDVQQPLTRIWPDSVRMP
jgi:alanine racemase